MDNLTLGKKIKQAREAKGVTLNDIAEKIGVAKSTIQRYENGKISTPKLPVVHAIASALDVNPSWLVGKSPDMYEPVNVNRSSAVRIPVLGSVPAGIPLEAIEDVIDYEEIPSAMASKGDYFALKINGHSMEPQIMDGDVIIVLKTDDVDSGDIAIVMVNGDDATRKNARNTVSFTYPAGISHQAGESYCRNNITYVNECINVTTTVQKQGTIIDSIKIGGQSIDANFTYGILVKNASKVAVSCVLNSNDDLTGKIITETDLDTGFWTVYMVIMQK